MHFYNYYVIPPLQKWFKIHTIYLLKGKIIPIVLWRPLCIHSKREISAGSELAPTIFRLPVIKLPLCAAGHRPKKFFEFFQPPLHIILIVNAPALAFSDSSPVLRAGRPCLSLFNDARRKGQVRPFSSLPIGSDGEVINT